MPWAGFQLHPQFTNERRDFPLERTKRRIGEQHDPSRAQFMGLAHDFTDLLFG